jgi:hypothetical protein
LAQTVLATQGPGWRPKARADRIGTRLPIGP